MAETEGQSKWEDWEEEAAIVARAIEGGVHEGIISRACHSILHTGQAAQCLEYLG